MTEPEETTTIYIDNSVGQPFVPQGDTSGNPFVDYRDEMVRQFLHGEEIYANLIRQQSERAKQLHDEWWANRSRWQKTCHRAWLAKCWVKKQWTNFRWWLSNKIYKHSESDW